MTVFKMPTGVGEKTLVHQILGHKVFFWAVTGILAIGFFHIEAAALAALAVLR